MSVSIVILAAGQGTRMQSALPKVLHPLAGKPLLEHVVEAALRLEPADIHVVYGHGGDTVKNRLSHLPVQWVEQAEQLGTGHAVAQALPNIEDANTVLVLYGDVPLIRTSTLDRLLASASASGSVSLLTAHLDVPKGYGRIIRGGLGQVAAIVEEKDATPEQRQIREVNTGLLAAPAAALKAWLAALDNNNAQGEYYLTDIIAKAVSEGHDVDAVHPDSTTEFLGVNNKAQLAGLERAYQREQAERLMTDGVTLLDPDRFDLRGTLAVGRDVTIDINVIFEGHVELGDGVYVGPHSVICDAIIGDDVEIRPHSVIEEATIGPGAIIGPFARLRPGAELDAGVHVGNFVEIKKSRIGERSKVNHLSYIGDAVVGKRVNIGAGTITCNYDGANKFQTVIEDDAFIGSDSQLVAPVTVGAGATIGAGSTITRDTPPGELTLSRAKQETRSGWKRPVKKSS